MRSFVTTLLLLATATVSMEATARDPFGGAGRHPRGVDRHTGVESPGSNLRSQADRLHRATARRKAEAGVRLLEQRRDLNRSVVEAGLRRSGTPAQVRAHRTRLEAQERSDDLRIRQRLTAADLEWWRGLGPDTRRVFLENGIVAPIFAEDTGISVRRAQRRQEQRRELDALEREAEAREPQSPW